MSSSRAGPPPVPDRGQVDDHGDVLVTAAGVAPHVLIDAGHGDTLEPGGVGDEHPLAAGQDRIVRGVPGHRQSLGDTGHAQVLTHDPFQRPPQAGPRQLAPPRRSLGGVLAPHVPTTGAPVAADRDLQRRWTPPQRLVRQPAHHAVTRRALTPAPPTPTIVINDPARQHRTPGLQALPGGLQAELVQAAER